MEQTANANIIPKYHIGCPMWANKDWLGRLFTQKAKPKDYLRQYAAVLNTVEGNHTFYGLPKSEQFVRWKQETPANFKFCFKFPKTISHVYKLHNVEQYATQFLKNLQPITDRIGVLFLQLPPSFNKSGMRRLERFITNLPHDFEYAVELRHRDFFDNDKIENALNLLLQTHGINRALFDTQTLHNIDSRAASILAAQRKKPNMPQRLLATGKHPFVRYVGYAQPEQNEADLLPIAQSLAQWIREGRQPFVFMHTPGDQYAPELCRFFHGLLKAEMSANKHEKTIDVGDFPLFANERQANSEQLSLF